MAYGIGLKFDTATENNITEIWHKLSEIGLATEFPLDGYTPHISIALSKELAVDPFVDEIGQVIESTPKIQICLSSISFFTNPGVVLFYGVTPTQALLQLQADSFAIYKQHATELSPFTHPNDWMPHCSLAFEVADDKLKNAFEIARSIPLPYSVPSVELVVVKHDRQRAEVLYSFPI